MMLLKFIRKTRYCKLILVEEKKNTPRSNQPLGSDWIFDEYVTYNAGLQYINSE